MMVVHCVCHLGFFHFGFAQGEDHGDDLQTVRYDSSGSYTYTLVWFNVSERGHISHPHFQLCFAGAKRE